jgi:hypothetical protein
MTKDAPTIILLAFAIAAIIDLAKKVSPIRRLFNRWTVTRWLFEGLRTPLPVVQHLMQVIGSQPIGSPRRASESDARSGRTNSPRGKKEGEDVEASMLELGTGGGGYALYDQDIGHVAAQLNILGELVLDFPARQRRLLKALAGVPDRRMSSIWGTRPQGQPPVVRQHETNRKRAAFDYEKAAARKDIAALLRLRRGFREAVATPKDNDSQNRLTDRQGQLIDARTRISHRIQRRLDTLQVRGGRHWTIFIQIIALAVGSVIAVRFDLSPAWLEIGSVGTTRISLPLIRINHPSGVRLALMAAVMAPIAFDVWRVVRRAGRE